MKTWLEHYTALIFPAHDALGSFFELRISHFCFPSYLAFLIKVIHSHLALLIKVFEFLGCHFVQVTHKPFACLH